MVPAPRPLLALVFVLAFGARAEATPPGPPAADREAGFEHGRQGRMLEALELLRPWALAHPEDLPARLAAVQAAVELSRLSDAQALLSGLTLDTPPVRVLRAQVARLEAEPRSVLEQLAPLLDQPPSGLERMVAWLAADALVALGRGAEAAARLRPWVEIDPTHGLLFAQASYQSGAVDEALATLEPWARRALSLGGGEGAPPEPSAAPIVLEYGRMLQAVERSAEAAKMLEAGLRWSPRSHQGWLNLGQALASLGRREEAKAALARFRELEQQRTGSAPGLPPG